MPTNVTLREKEISKGRLSLYLDYYPPIPHPQTGKLTRREFLKLYIIKKPSTPIARKSKKDTILIAQAIRARRENDLNKPEIYSLHEQEKLKQKAIGERSFLEYFKNETDKRYGANRFIWLAAFKHLQAFSGGTIKFKDLNIEFLESFKAHLLTTSSLRSSKHKLSQNTALSYFNKVKATLKQAYKERLLSENLSQKIDGIKLQETRREYLTIEELKKLWRTECKIPVLRNAALFSALTGLRFSDIAKLKWKEIEHIQGDGYVLNFTQKKTKHIESHPITVEAYNLTNGNHRPDEMPQEDNVFQGLKYSAHLNKVLKSWIETSKIRKKISFHNFRHTYATLQLASGTNFYTVSKLLGHKNAKTTQVYLNVVNKEKREAANRLNLNLSND